MQKYLTANLLNQIEGKVVNLHKKFLDILGNREKTTNYKGKLINAEGQYINIKQLTIYGKTTQLEIPSQYHQVPLEVIEDNICVMNNTDNCITYNLANEFLAELGTVRDYIENGILHKFIGKIVLDGTEPYWMREVNAKGFLLSYAVETDYPNAISNTFVAQNSFITWTGINKFGFNTSGTFWCMPEKVFDTIEEWKQYLNENNIVIYYILKKPYTIKLNDFEEIILKNGLNRIENSANSEMSINISYYDKAVDSKLKNIEVGDDLSNKVCYFNFPWDSYLDINEKVGEHTDFININQNNYICQKMNDEGTAKYIGYKYQGQYQFLYYKFDNQINNLYNYIRYRFPQNYGCVISIDKSNKFYQCIKIKDSPVKVLEYNKKTWLDNEIPYLQDIDNIEQGIQTIADIWYLPLGYEKKDWTTLGYYNIENSDYGLAQKPINESDFLRWNKNIELLEQSFNSFFNVWNVVSYISWNENSKFEWEEL